MRLLHVDEHGQFSLTDNLLDNIPPYAILSHTWGADDEEVTFEDLTRGPRKTKAGYRKLRFCAEQASRDGLPYFWVDTCCIDKSNNSELSEAIISMFRWYQSATKCYVYLADVSINGEDPASQSFRSWGPAFRRSRWFTRGWTLQELIAPSAVEFYSKDGKPLGDKRSLERHIHKITGIPVMALRGRSMSEFSVAERLSWAKSRVTKREEDRAYSLLGMFDVYMPPLYGEGFKSASRRLRDEIEKHAESRAKLLQPNLSSLEATSSKLSLQESVPKLTVAQIEEIKDRLLRHLSFPVIRDREDRIDEAMEATFEWIFHEQKPTGDPVAWNPFVAWLKSDDGLYWIAGKPGSGKSTLMKFLHSDPRTEEYLRIWAKKSRLVIGGHFFWNSGSSIQMSIEGLVRTLLHSIGTQLPEMLPKLFPKLWADIESKVDPMLMELQLWSASECLEAFRRLLSHAFNKFRIFFFIDGLDECDGDHEELTALLKEMAASPHIKMCLASRPWNVFQDAFDSSPSLMLQHLTSKDIRVYVHKRFYEHQGFLELQKGDSKLANELFDDITEKASGVFLWVRLAVQSLLHGIANGDRVIDLKRRLEELPADLETFFRRILDSVDPAYKIHSAQLFQIHRTASNCGNGLDLLQFSYADEPDQALLHEDDTPLGRDEYVYRLQLMKRRLESRTKGLLEAPSWFIDDQPLEDAEHVPRVQYLHRTLKDYIERPEIWKQVCGAAPSFSLHTSLCKAYALEVKKIDCHRNVKSPIRCYRTIDARPHVSILIDCIMFVCSMAEDWQYKSLIFVLDRLETIIQRKFSPEQDQIVARDRSVTQALLTPPHLMSVAIHYDLNFWVAELLRRGHPATTAGPPPSRFVAIALGVRAYSLLPDDPDDPAPKIYDVWTCPSLMCLKSLFSHGADPNEVASTSSTAWSFLIDRISGLLENHLAPERAGHPGTTIDAWNDYWIDAAELFIEYSASASLMRKMILSLVRRKLKRYHSFWASTAFQRLCKISEVDPERLIARSRMNRRDKARVLKEMRRTEDARAQEEMRRGSEARAREELRIEDEQRELEEIGIETEERACIEEQNKGARKRIVKIFKIFKFCLKPLALQKGHG